MPRAAQGVLFRQTGGTALQFYKNSGVSIYIKSLFIQNEYVFLWRENELELAVSAN